MAINPGLLPNDRAPISDSRGLAMQEWRDFFLLLASQTENDEFAAELNALAERVAALEASGGDLAMLIPGTGISINGLLTDPFVLISLDAFLADLKDVSGDVPAEGDRLTWDAALGEWKPAPDPTPASGEILIQDGSSAPPVMLTNEAEDDFLYGDT